MVSWNSFTASKFTAKSDASIALPVSSTGNEFGKRDITFFAEAIAYVATAFPENTFFFTVNESPEIVGLSTAPATMPAFNFAAKRGATSFPVKS